MVIADIQQGRKPIIMLFNTLESATKNFVEAHNELVEAHNTAFPDSAMKRIEVGDAIYQRRGTIHPLPGKSRTIKITEPYLDELTGKQVTALTV